jgi:hypothetical protein
MALAREQLGDDGDDVDDDDIVLPDRPETLVQCVDIGDGLRVPTHILDRLFPYQRRGVSWMWGLHRQGTGGILADEMGAWAARPSSLGCVCRGRTRLPQRSPPPPPPTPFKGARAPTTHPHPRWGRGGGLGVFPGVRGCARAAGWVSPRDPRVGLRQLVLAAVSWSSWMHMLVVAGLGKTAQVIALLASLWVAGKLGPVLVVCPATVMAHWLR